VISVPPRRDPEESMVRQFAIPTPRRFGLAGDARLSPFLADDAIDRLLGYEGPVVATSSEHLSGAPQDRASAAVDQDLTTAWVTPFAQVNGHFVDLSLPGPISVDHLDLQLVADGRHSVPTRIAITNEAGEPREVDLPAVTDRPEANGVVAAPVRFPALTGTRFRVTVLSAREVTTREWYCECDLAMPVGIAELGMPGVPAVRVPAEIPAECRNDLVTIDGRPVPARIVGTTADAIARNPLPLVSCTGGEPPVASLGRGRHVLRTQPGKDLGFDVDRLSLASLPGGAPWTEFDAGGAPADPEAEAQTPRTPDVEVLESGRAKTTVRITGATAPFWLVLGQSNNPGWRATADGDELGESTLADGYGNGWLIRPAGAGAFEVSLEWVPQRTVNQAIVLSLVSVFLCGAILLVSTLRRRRRQVPVAAGSVGFEHSEATLASPLVAYGHRPRAVGIVFATLVALVAGGIFVTPWVGVLLAAAVLLVLLRPRWRAVLSLVPAFALAGCGAYIAAKQWHSRLPATFEWPTFFWQVRTLGWISIVFLAGDALVEIARSHRSRRRRRRERESARSGSGEVDPLRD
jgi:arabinofuranan 3-O-arabinosyltransferase